MLILTRKIGESVIIGGDVVLTLVDIRRGNALIGVEAPREVAVDREEVRGAKERDAAEKGGAAC